MTTAAAAKGISDALQEFCLQEAQLAVEAPYDWLLGDAMAGDNTLFTREDAVEAAWAVVDPVVHHHDRVLPYKSGSWGPAQADKRVAPAGGWHNPAVDATRPLQMAR